MKKLSCLLLAAFSLLSEAQAKVKLSTLISSWRDAWGAPCMPFYFVQLPCWENNDYAKFWHVNRQSMLNVLRSTPDVGMAVSVDVGDIHDLHPTNKRPVGERLALWALAKAYGKPVVFSGPLVSKVTPEADKLRIAFDTCGSALKLHGTEWADLEIAGEDGIYYPATSALTETEAVVGSASVPKPLAVIPYLINKQTIRCQSKTGSTDVSSVKDTRLTLQSRCLNGRDARSPWAVQSPIFLESWYKIRMEVRLHPHALQPGRSAGFPIFPSGDRSRK